MRVSVVVPAYENPAGLERCLRALVAAVGPDDEIVVVDDASTDDTPAVASRFDVRLVRLARNSGAGAARNAGAAEARGDVLLFVDSDVVVAPDTVESVRRTFEQEPEVAAVFGSYDASPAEPGLVSQFRNLLHHFVHQQGETEASTFWAGCGAVRRPAFEALGGFDRGDYIRAIEDIELGYRLRDAGHRIRLDKDLRVTHLKRWTLGSFLRTDVRDRALPWARLILSRGARLDHLNLTRSHRARVALAVVGIAALALAPVSRGALLVAAAAAVAFVAVNRRVLAFFRRERGFLFAAAAVPLLALHYLAAAVGYAWAWSSRRPAGAAG